MSAYPSLFVHVHPSLHLDCLDVVVQTKSKKEKKDNKKKKDKAAAAAPAIASGK